MLFIFVKCGKIFVLKYSISKGESSMNDEITALKKEIRINRILLIVLLSLFIIFLVAVGVAFVYAYRFVTEVKPYIDELSKLDVEKFNSTVDSLSKLNIEAINEAISSATEDINAAKEAMSAFSNSLSSLFGGFGK